MNVYRSYDQHELDKQYNVRAGIPDYMDIFAGWKVASQQFREQRSVRENIQYGASEKQALDYFYCGQSGRPVLVFIHGGYWQSLDKSDFSTVASPYIDKGVNVAVVNYRLAPDVRMSDIVSDVRDSIQYLYEQADALGFDGSAIFVSGHSAGGHLTAIMAGTDWASLGLPADLVKGACAISGLYDLEPIRLCYLNKVIGLVESDVPAFSPVYNLPKYKLPIILTVGGDESDEYHRLQEQYAQLLAEQGLDVRVVPQDGGHHFDAVDRLGFADHPLSAAVLQMIGEHFSKH